MIRPTFASLRASGYHSRSSLAKKLAGGFTGNMTVKHGNPTFHGKLDGETTA
jgi:hypothetical protein